MTDNNPKSPVIQNLPPALFMLFVGTACQFPPGGQAAISLVPPPSYKRKCLSLSLTAFKPVCSKPDARAVDRSLPMRRARERDSRFRVYEEAPCFRAGPRVVTRAQARGDQDMLPVIRFTLSTFCL